MGWGIYMEGKDGARTLVRMVTMRAALRLEVLGMSRRGQSVYSMIKKEWNLKGSKKKVLEQFDAIVEQEKTKFKEDQ